MAQVHLEIQSFNAGELSPLLGSRFNVEKVQSGCRRLRNFLIHVHGPAFRRPGMEYLGPAAGNGGRSRLLPFNFSTTTGAILEFHPNGLRVWSNGLLVPLRAPVDLPYTEAECAEVQFVQVNDVCYIAHPNHAPRKLIRYADNDWRISEVPWKWPAMGDENVRSDEIASPTVTELFSVPTQEWPEFATSGIGTIIFSIINPDLSATRKTAKLQRLISGAWVTAKTLTWTTIAPTFWSTNWNHDYLARITYDGPITATGIARVTWPADDGQGDLPLDVAQPVSAREFDIPAGDWQATVASPSTIPAHAALEIQEYVSRRWRTLHKMQLLPDRTTTFRGAKVVGTLKVRFVWTGRMMDGGLAKIDQPVFPTATDITLAVSETTGTGRTLTASSPLFTSDHIGSYWQITHHREKPWVGIASAVTTIAAETSPALTVQGKWQVTSFGIWAANIFLEKLINGVWTTLRTWNGNKDRNITADGDEDHAVELRLRISAGTSEAATTAAFPRFLLEALTPEVSGLVKVTAIGSLDASGKATTATIDIVSPPFDTSATPTWTEGAWSDAKGHPRCVALHGGRLWFGGTRTEPMRLWGSVVNDYQDFRRTSFDDAGLSFTPAATAANSMQWMLSHERELIIGTAGDEWTLGTESGPVTPVNVLMQLRSNYGSESQPATVINESVVFLQRGARKLRQIIPRTDAVAWSASDLTVLAEHVSVRGFSQFAVSTNPFSILWAVSGDGKLLGMTFEVEQNVFGWHVHETDGLVESVAVIRAAEVDEIWLCVNRAGVRSIERFDSLVLQRRFDLREQLIYLDAATRKVSPNEFSQVTGLGHLEGRTVSLMADGIEYEPRRVLAGAVNLDIPARAAVVGLPFLSELQPMRMDIPLRDGTAQGRKFKVSRVALLLHESAGGEVASAPEAHFEKLQSRRTATLMGYLPPLVNGQVETSLSANTSSGIDVIVRQSAPLPFNIAAIVINADVTGD